MMEPIVRQHWEAQSQSHRTDQGSSKSTPADPGYPPTPQKSQSHRTDQGSSKSDRSNRLSLQVLKLGIFMTRLESRLCFSFSTAFQLTSSRVTHRALPAAAPSGLGYCFKPLTRGRRSFVALTPGYVFSPLRGSQSKRKLLLSFVPLIRKSQSHRTDQGSSKGDRSNPLSLPARLRRESRGRGSAPLALPGLHGTSVVKEPFLRSPLAGERPGGRGQGQGAGGTVCPAGLPPSTSKTQAAGKLLDGFLPGSQRRRSGEPRGAGSRPAAFPGRAAFIPPGADVPPRGMGSSRKGAGSAPTVIASAPRGTASAPRGMDVAGEGRPSAQVGSPPPRRRRPPPQDGPPSPGEESPSPGERQIS